MPWRFIFFILAVLLGALFAALNIEKVTVSFGFYQFKDIFLFAALIFAYLAGALTVIPLIFIRSLRKKRRWPKMKQGKIKTDAKDSLPKKK